MDIKEKFDIGTIMEWEDKSKKIPTLTSDDCVIVNKALNNKKIILHMKRVDDDSEGKVFVRLKDEFSGEFDLFKKLLASKKIIGMTLAQFKKFTIEEL
jgi:hypothetical protein